MSIASEIPSKSVFDILSNNENVPAIFTRKFNNLAEVGGSSALPWTDCPVVDFSLLFSSTNELENLHSALLTWGCFQLINHGISDSFLEEVREVSKEFFVQPIEERTKFLRAPNNPEGYGNDTVLSQNVPHNWNDRLYLKVYPMNQRKLNFWPLTPPNFREILHEYTMKIKGVNETLIQAMGRCLGLEDDSFIKEYGDEMMNIATRINYYPKCPLPELVHASRAHSDASSMTILLQDNHVEGLQVLKDDTWFKVPIIPSALFVNVGDQMEIMSNGAFKSAVHKVVANSERERLSVAMFCSPDSEKEIGPLEKLVNENQPPLYKSFKRYGEIFFQYHPNGQRPITAMKI